MLVADVSPENPRERPPRARMRFRFRQLAVFGLRARVGAHADQRMPQPRAHIVFVHDRNDDRALAAVGNDEIHHGVARILPHRLPDRRERHPFVLAQLGSEHQRQHHAVAAARSVPLILPGGGGRVGHVGFDLLALRRILEPSQHLVEPALAHPQRQARVEAVRRTRVRIQIRRHVQPARPRRLDALQHLRHLAPVRLVRCLQVPDLRGNVGPLGDREHFVERLEDLGTLRSLVREIDAAVPRGHFRQLDDLVG